MLPYRRPDHVLEIAPEQDRAVDETSDEAFDRSEFARRALELLDPPRTTVAICEGASRLRVESGRVWGGGTGARWAMLAIPPRASRRAIALAVAQLAHLPRPYVLDVLLSS
jgi:hypothetical protein